LIQDDLVTRFELAVGLDAVTQVHAELAALDGVAHVLAAVG
jgi:hypothetical protein